MTPAPTTSPDQNHKLSFPSMPRSMPILVSCGTDTLPAAQNTPTRTPRIKPLFCSKRAVLSSFHPSDESLRGSFTSTATVTKLVPASVILPIASLLNPCHTRQAFFIHGYQAAHIDDPCRSTKAIAIQRNRHPATCYQSAFCFVRRGMSQWTTTYRRNPSTLIGQRSRESRFINRHWVTKLSPIPNSSILGRVPKLRGNSL